MAMGAKPDKSFDVGKMKKGIMFSLILISLTITLLSMIEIQKGLVHHKREQISIEARLNDMYKMYEGIVRDVNKASDIITKRAISVCISSIVSEGVSLNNSQESLAELAWNGTLHSTPQSLMENNTLPDWIAQIKNVGDTKGYNINIIITNFEVKPYDSWNLVTTGVMNINISDKGGTASLNRDETLNHLTSIEGFEDPTYPLNTIGRATNLIAKAGYENYTELLIDSMGNSNWVYGQGVVIPASSMAEILNVPDKDEKILVTDDASLIPLPTVNQFLGIVSEETVSPGATNTYVYNASGATVLIENSTNLLVDGDKGRVWFIDTLKNHTENSVYYTSTVGASFLDRLEGSLEVQEKYANQTNYTIGLESFVNKVYLLLLDLDIKNQQTNIDYLYFSNDVINGYAVKGLDPTFRIDNITSLGSTHHAIYGVSELLI